MIEVNHILIRGSLPSWWRLQPASSQIIKQFKQRRTRTSIRHKIRNQMGSSPSILYHMNSILGVLRLSPSQRSVSAVIRLGSLCFAIAALSGCVVEETQRRPRRSTVIVEETPPPLPPQVIVADTPPPDQVMVVQEAPPPPREEIIIERERPSPRHVWINGYWGWREGRQAWVGGHWELPPREHVVWVEPRWDHRANGYVFVAGSWRDNSVVVKKRVVVQPSPSVSVHLNFVAVPPPPPRHEVVIESQRPSREHVWIKGYYVWRENHHAWIAGHWERPPHPHAVWVEPRWEKHPEGHVFIEGFWR